MTDPKLYEWIVQRRVSGGGMAKSAGMYFDHGRPVPEHMLVVFDRLIWNGLLVVTGGDPIWELRRLSLTEVGQARYVVLGREGHESQQRHEEQQGNRQQQHRHTELEVPGVGKPWWSHAPEPADRVSVF